MFHNPLRAGRSALCVLLLLMSIDLAAQVADAQWQYSQDINYYDKFEKAILCSDGGFFLAGRAADNYGQSLGSFSMVYQKLNASGTRLWTASIGQTFSAPPLVEPLQLSNGNFLVNTSYTGAQLINGTTGAMSPSISVDGQLAGFAQLSDGRIGIEYTSYDDMAIASVGIKLVSPDLLTTYWDYTFGTSSSLTPVGIAVSSEGTEFAIAGYTSTGGWARSVTSDGTDYYGNLYEQTTVGIPNGMINNLGKEGTTEGHMGGSMSIVPKASVSRMPDPGDFLLTGVKSGKQWIGLISGARDATFPKPIRSASVSVDGRVFVVTQDSIYMLNNLLKRVWQSDEVKDLNIEVLPDNGLLIYGGADFRVVRTKPATMVISDYFVNNNVRHGFADYGDNTELLKGVFDDFNKDGVVDYHVLIKDNNVQYYDDELNLYSILTAYFQGTAGRFTTPAQNEIDPSQWGLPSAANFYVDDIDNDGNLEVFNNSIQNLNSDGNTFTAQTNNLVIVDNYNYSNLSWGDFDNNGLLDVFVNLDAIYLQNPANTFTKLTSSSAFGGSMKSPIVADLNNDGYLDLIDGPGKAVWLNSSATTFTKTATTYQASFPIELNNDSFIDFIGYDGVTTWYKFINNGSGVFTYSALGLLSPQAAGDVNKDGRTDIIAKGHGGYYVYVNDGSGNFSSSLNYDYYLPSTNGGAPQVAPADIDNDGDLDLALLDVYQLAFWRNDNTGNNSAPSAPSASLVANKNASVPATVTFTWAAGADDTTPANSLSYNIYVKNGSQLIVNPNSILANGKRTLVNTGNAGLAKTFILKNLPVGTYQWGVQSIDKSLAASSFSAEQTLYITNNPTNVSLSAATIVENSIATIGTFTTTDPDAGETYTYSLVAGTGSTDNALFKITGTALTALTATSLNFETKSSYSIRIRTTDSRQGFFEKVFTITVTNVQETATDITLSSSSIAENQPAGTTVGTLTSNDPDAGDTNTFSLVTGTGDTNNASFTISGNALKTAASFNFEVKSSYSIRIQTKDQNNNSFQKVFTITITDVNDLLAPVIATPTAVSQAGFTIAWPSIEGATAYELDLSTTNFTDFVSGFNAKVLSTSPFTVTGLTAGTTYKVRMRATKSTDKSSNSTIVTQALIPPDPVLQNLGATDITATSFKASWLAATGATSYELEVSVGTGTFTAMAGYNPKVITGSLEETVINLTTGIVYKYRLKAVNSAGKSNYSNEKSATPTIGGGSSKPIAQPTSIHFSALSSTSVNVSFTAAAGPPTGYFVLYRPAASPTETPADGTVYAVNDVIGTSKVAYSGSTPSFNLSSLSAATQYYFDIFSYNLDGASRTYLTTSPLQGDVVTLTPQPVAQPTSLNFASITTTGASGAFTPATGSPLGYIIIRSTSASATDAPSDATEYISGSTIGSSVVVAVGAGTTFTDSNLSPGTTYYYSVFAFNGTGTSRNYLESNPAQQSLITIPSAPSLNIAANVTSVSFLANWSAVTGATSYELDVSTDDFATLTKNATGITATEYQVNGLDAKTNYKFRVRAVNANGGKSVSSDARTVRTSDPPASLQITTSPTVTSVMTGFTSSTIPVTVTGGSSARTVTMNHRGVLSSEFIATTAISKGGDSYEVTIDPSMLDDLGMEYYFEVTDTDGEDAKQSSNSYVYKKMTDDTAPSVPFASGFTGETQSYQMFSIPYELSNTDIEKIFDIALGGRDKTKWRLYHFSNGSNKEYPNEFLQVKQGDGYWFNTIVDEFDIKIGAASVPNRSQSNPFVINLASGWNQIGNPYPYNISWDAVVNGNTNIGDLNFWSNGNYTTHDVFKAWEGAFVFNSSTTAISLQVPVTARTTSGRIISDELQATLDKEAWKLPLHISSGSFGQSAGIGMHPEANTSKDRFDKIVLPHFIKYAEMSTDHPEFFAPQFATDILPTASKHEWSFTVNSNAEGNDVMISWDAGSISSAQSSLIMIDMMDKTWIDMKTTTSYSFASKDGRQLKIVYNQKGDIDAGMNIAGAAYPNPFSSDVTIPLLLTGNNNTVSVGIYTMLGQKVKTLSRAFNKGGIHYITWDGKDEQGFDVSSGLLIYRIEDLSGTGAGRLIKK